MAVEIPALVPRADFDLLGKVTYLNQASLGLIPAPALARTRDYDRAHLGRGNYGLSDEAEAAILDEVRIAAAGLLRTQPVDLAITSGATEVIGQIAWASQPGPTSNIVCIGDDFPSVTYPWLRVAEVTGSEVRMASAADRRDSSTFDRIAARVDDDTAVICVSHVLYHTGERLDELGLRGLADSVGALLVLDITQSAGVIDIDLAAADPDFAVASGYKWLCGPGGAAVAYVSPLRQAAFRPAIPGWKGTPDPFEFDARAIHHAPGARRLELSTMAYGAALGLGAAMGYLDSVGAARIEQHVRDLGDYLSAGLTDLGAEIVTPLEPSRRAGIITAQFSEHDPRTLVGELANARVITSFRGGGIRFSLDLYNDSSDVDRAVAALRGCLE